MDVISNAQVGSYLMYGDKYSSATFKDTKTGCYWNSQNSATKYGRGTLTITRLDLKAGIISGTFDFTLYRPGCDSIRVTAGRFDKRL
jgi:hypothetical protein